MSEKTDEKLTAETFRKRTVAPTDFVLKEQELGLRGRAISMIAKAVGVDPKKILKTKTLVPSYIWDADPKLRRPEYDYFSLVELAQKSWILRRTFGVIIKECTRNWGEIQAKFKVKCNKCGRMYQTTEVKCKCGAGAESLVEPDYDQYLKMFRLTTEPSPDRSFREFIRATIFYELATDDFYWSVIYKKLQRKGALVQEKIEGDEVHVEHSGYMFPMGDKYGYLGGYEYFCPVCYGKGKYVGMDGPVEDLAYYTKVGKELPPAIKCKECGGPMIRTAYVQEIGGQVTARFGRNEIIHGSLSRLPPELFGNPKLATLLKLVKTIVSVDDYELETTTEGKVGGLLAFPGLDQDKVTEILTNVKTERAEIKKRDEVTGDLETSKRTALIFVGLEEGEQPIKVPFLDKDDMEQTLKFYQMYMNAIDSVYGVESVTEVVEIKGSTSKEVKTKVEVTRETAMEHQAIFMDLFNNKLLPLCGITDWVWVFNKLEPKDKLREVEILHQTAATALTAGNAGLKVVWNEDNSLTISGEAKPVKQTAEDQPNQEAGVVPRKPGRERGRTPPTEISPRTGEETTGGDKEE